jgi:hypothetical protein
MNNDDVIWSIKEKLNIPRHAKRMIFLSVSFERGFDF